jgi:hypothetical protein
MSEETPATERLKVASDPGTSAATLADLAYDHPDVRAAIAGNPAAYDGLLAWLAELDDPTINEVLSARLRGVADASDSNILRLTTAPTEVLPNLNEPIALPSTEPERLAPVAQQTSHQPFRWPAFMTRRFVLIVSGIVVLAIIAGVIGVSSHNAVLAAQASSQAKSEQAAADKANAANAGSDPQPSHTAVPSPTPTTSPTPVPPPNIVPAGFSQTWTQGFVGSGGYTETVTVSVGAPEPLGSNYPRQIPDSNCTSTEPGGCGTMTFTSGKTCTANKATDAVVPISVDTTSTTSGFSQIVGERLSFQSNSQLQYEASYNTGSQCNDGSSGQLSESGSSVKPVKNGETTSLPMFLIIQNYYAPDHPRGDPSLLAGISISVSGSSSSSVSWASDGKPVTYQSIDSPSSTLSPGSALQLG